jgi:glyoxylase-like metal-dependent hydrolase (beta-lactamase superfamily II)
MEQRATGGRSQPDYRLYAVHYASSNPDRSADHNFMAPVDFHDMPMPLDFFVWVAIGEGRVILIDTGAEEEICRSRGHNYYRSPAEGLAALGHTAEDVTDVIVTHMHWDHLGHLANFPNARIHVHKQEMSHATGCAMCHAQLRRPYDVTQVCSLIVALYGGRVSFTDETAEIAAGVCLRHVGGHAPGLQVVQIQTRRGKVVLASDAMHYFANSILTNPYPVVVNVQEYLDGLGLVERLADGPDHVIPGHDPLVKAMYPSLDKAAYVFDLSVPPRAPRPLAISGIVGAYGRPAQA